VRSQAFAPFGEVRLHLFRLPRIEPLLERLDAPIAQHREVCALDAQVRDPGAAQRQREAHPDPVAAGRWSLGHFGDAQIEAAVDSIDARAQSGDHGRSPDAAAPERAAGLDPVAGALGKVGVEDGPVAGEVGDLEGAHVPE